MIIYGALFMPIFTAFVLYKFFNHKTVWWEFIIPFIFSIVFVCGMKWLIEVSMVTSKEYWGSIVKKIEYYEDWDEWIEQTCTREYACGTDSEGNTEYCTETYDCSYREYHPPYWQIITTTNEIIGISEQEYTKLKNILGGETFYDMHRDYYTDDGDMYFCNWLNDSIRAIPVTTTHYYENKIKATDRSIFNFVKVDTSDIRRFGLYEYPTIASGYNQDAVFGDNSKDGEMANKKIKYFNGLLGPVKEVKLFVLVFQDKPIDAGFYQEAFWTGANMNEFVVAIGIDKGRRVKWCHPFSWTPSETLKSDVKQFVISQDSLNLCALSSYIGEQVNKRFVRRDFKEFDYLTVEPPTWSVILTYILTIILNIGLSIYIIKNEHEEN